MQAAIPIAERLELSRPQWVRSHAPSAESLLLASVGALSFAVAFWLHLDAPWLRLFACPFRSATGLPCLGCGATHAFVYLAHGQVSAALLANPLWALVAAGLWGYALCTLLRGAGLRWTLAFPRLAPKVSRRFRFLLFAAAAANWSFVALTQR